MNSLRAGWAVAVWTWTKVARRPVVLSFSFVQPLLWLAFFGFLFHRYPLGDGLDVPYLDFLVPGVCGMTALFGASQSGIAFIRDMQTGFFERLMHTPTSPVVIVGAKIGADALRVVAQAAVVLALGVLLGADLSLAPGPLLAGVAALFAFAFAFASISNLLAFMARVPEVMATFVHVVNMPILFTSTALVPARDMPPFLAGVAAYNPLSAAVDVLREALLHGVVHPNLGMSLASLGTLGLVCFAAAVAAATRSD
jgi:ABC-2 type transport system permease protein